MKNKKKFDTDFKNKLQSYYHTILYDMLNGDWYFSK